MHRCIQHASCLVAFLARKSFRNRPQIGPKSVQNRSKIGFGTDLAANIDFGPFWNRFRTVLGPLLAASWRPLGGQVGVKLVQKLIFGGPGWRSKTNMKWLQHGSKNDPSWGPKTLWAPSGGRPRAKKERHPRRDQKTTRIWRHLGPDKAKTTMGDSKNWPRRG